MKVTYRNSIVWIIENNLDISRQHSGTSSFVQQCLTLFGAQMGEFITEYELYSKEEITFAWTISTNDYIMPFVEWLNNRLLTITLEPLDNNLWKIWRNFI